MRGRNSGGCDRTNYVAGAQDDDGSADRQYGNDNFKDDKSKDNHRYGDGHGSVHGCEAKDYGIKYRHKNSFETIDYGFQRYDSYVKRAKASKKSHSSDQAIGRTFKMTDEGALY